MKKSVPIEASVARRIAIEKALTGKDIYLLIREAWHLYEARKTGVLTAAPTATLDETPTLSLDDTATLRTVANMLAAGQSPWIPTIRQIARDWQERSKPFAATPGVVDGLAEPQNS